MNQVSRLNQKSTAKRCAPLSVRRAFVVAVKARVLKKAKLVSHLKRARASINLNHTLDLFAKRVGEKRFTHLSKVLGLEEVKTLLQEVKSVDVFVDLVRDLPVTKSNEFVLHELAKSKSLGQFFNGLGSGKMAVSFFLVGDTSRVIHLLKNPKVAYNLGGLINYIGAERFNELLKRVNDVELTKALDSKKSPSAIFSELNLSYARQKWLWQH